MIRRVCSFVCVVAVAGLLGFVGCNGGDNPDVKKLQEALDIANGRNEVLEQDSRRLSDSLKQAESRLAETTDAANKLQVQVRDLTKSRDDLTVKVNDLSVARTDLQKKVDDLSTARTNLQAKVDDLSAARTDLQKKVADLTQARDDLQKTVQSLTSVRSALEKQVADLSKARNVALEDAKTAQGKIEQLNNKIKVQTQQMTELQDQIVNIRTVLEHLRKSLEQDGK